MINVFVGISLQLLCFLEINQKITQGH